MQSFPALDVAIALALTYFFLSIIATAATEGVAHLRNQRARTLESWIGKMLSGAAATGRQEAVTEFYKSPEIGALSLSSGGGHPSYIPSSHFVSATLGLTKTAGTAGRIGEETWETIGAQLRDPRIKDTAAGQALLSIYRRSDEDAARFRLEAEAWFDDQMERLSGVYRRWSQRIVWAVGIALVMAFNANTIQMVDTLYRDPARRDVIVAQAGNATASAKAGEALSRLDGNFAPPLGWARHGGYSGWWTVAVAPAGWLLTFLAISLGAPFWFDTLSKLARVRTTGTPPPATNATRKGEGDQERNAQPPPPEAG
ncbi:MAG TPA: hypothetical protein VFX13_15510 [Gaiellales bacterium]|jgi:hypothetical protein|nr:hypothetical protein [Gaiellales bacterium]